MPFNLTLMDDNADILAPALLGEELSAGETLSHRFFDLVEEGDWTWELLAALCDAIWLDLDGDGQNSIGDRLGIIGDKYGGVNSSVFIYSCGSELVEHHIVEDTSDPNYGKMWAYYPEDGSMLYDIFDAVAAVFNGRGAITTYVTDMTANSPEEPGLAYHHTKFAEGTLLTASACLLGDLEDESFQSMTDIYSVVPSPKVHADDEYNTFITNTGDAGAINVNTHPTKTRAITAYVQYCTENSGDIIDEFLNIVTKYKTTTYNQGTERMLDLIYEHVVYGGAKVIDDTVGGSYRWHGIMKDHGFTDTGSDLADDYETYVTSKQGELDKILNQWYTLPKVEEGQ